MSVVRIGLALCECGHPLAEHVDSEFWGPRSICVHKLADEDDGWYGVCPCVRGLLDGEDDD